MLWKQIKGYEGLYEVSNTGKVRSMNYSHTGKVKELSPRNNRGYLMVDLHKEGKRKQFRVHRLVVEAFIGEIPKGLIVNHKDENKHNNNVENLEICTIKYNNNYGSVKERISTTLTGIKRSPETCAKLSAAMKGNKNACKKCKK